MRGDSFVSILDFKQDFKPILCLTTGLMGIMNFSECVLVDFKGLKNIHLIWKMDSHNYFVLKVIIYT